MRIFLYGAGEEGKKKKFWQYTKGGKSTENGYPWWGNGTTYTKQTSRYGKEWKRF